MATAPTTVPAAGPALPDPPSSTDTATFDARADAFFDALPVFQTNENALAANVYTNAVGAYNNALEVSTNTLAVAANTALAALYAGATVWVSGASYVIGNKRYSPLNGRVYNRRTNGAGTTDPSADPTNWSPANIATPAQLVTLPIVQAISGQSLALVNDTAQAAATNSLLHARALDNAAWTKSGATVSVNSDTSPYSGVTADKLVESATNAVHYISQSITTAANVPRTLWCVAKAGGRNFITMEFDRDGTGTDMVFCTYNFLTALPSAPSTSGTASGATAAMYYMGAGWFLCSLSGTCSTSAGTSVRSLVYIASGSAYLGDGSSGVFFAHMQNELGSSFTSAIDTTSAPVTRTAGEVAPQRVVLPLNPAADDSLRIVIGNGIYTNMIDPNGQSFEGAVDGVQFVDDMNRGTIDLQFVDNDWKVIAM